ncbi:hypothetical protein AAG906_025858 [Vitis piasezkii]
MATLSSISLIFILVLVFSTPTFEARKMLSLKKESDNEGHARVVNINGRFFTLHLPSINDHRILEEAIPSPRVGHHRILEESIPSPGVGHHRILEESIPSPGLVIIGYSKNLYQVLGWSSQALDVLPSSLYAKQESTMCL